MCHYYLSCALWQHPPNSPAWITSSQRPPPPPCPRQCHHIPSVHCPTTPIRWVFPFTFARVGKTLHFEPTTQPHKSTPSLSLPPDPITPPHVSHYKPPFNDEVGFPLRQHCTTSWISLVFPPCPLAPPIKSLSHCALCSWRYALSPVRAALYDSSGTQSERYETTSYHFLSSSLLRGLPRSPPQNCGSRSFIFKS